MESPQIPSERTIRGFAALDLLVTAPLAVPGVAGGLLALLYRLDAALGGAAGAVPALPSLGWLFVHLAGILGVVWAVARLRMPDPRLARIDGVGRTAVAGLLSLGILGGDVPAVFWAFVATELAGAVAQLLPRGRAS